MRSAPRLFCRPTSPHSSCSSSFSTVVATVAEFLLLFLIPICIPGLRGRCSTRKDPGRAIAAGTWNPHFLTALRVSWTPGLPTSFVDCAASLLCFLLRISRPASYGTGIRSFVLQLNVSLFAQSFSCDHLNRGSHSRSASLSTPRRLTPLPRLTHVGSHPTSTRRTFPITSRHAYTSPVLAIELHCGAKRKEAPSDFWFTHFD